MSMTSMVFPLGRTSILTLQNSLTTSMTGLLCLAGLDALQMCQSRAGALSFLHSSVRQMLTMQLNMPSAYLARLALFATLRTSLVCAPVTAAVVLTILLAFVISLCAVASAVPTHTLLLTTVVTRWSASFTTLNTLLALTVSTPSSSALTVVENTLYVTHSARSGSVIGQLCASLSMTRQRLEVVHDCAAPRAVLHSVQKVMPLQLDPMQSLWAPMVMPRWLLQSHRLSVLLQPLQLFLHERHNLSSSCFHDQHTQAQ